ncbi:MAG: glycoside hydrolase N-terminal domain-containing protein, partial [Draconibacterium sp.]|nr:glycoside hydrolase N-terminal domain-containing protein [Draconibacterium sp.]
MNTKNLLLSLLLLLLVISCTKKGEIDFNQKLWYTYPAKYWNSQALHLGNGYFGASFFGGVEKETFALTKQSMWTGEPAMGDWEKAGVNPKALESIPKIREAVVNRDYKLADKLTAENVFGSSEKYGYFTSIGELNIEFENQSEDATNYNRELDLLNSLGKVSYSIGETNFNREYFCS